MLPVAGGSLGSPTSKDGVSPDRRPSGQLERVFEEDDEDEMVCTPSSDVTPRPTKGNSGEVDVQFNLETP